MAEQNPLKPSAPARRDPFHSLDFGASLARRIPSAVRTVVEGAGGSILWTHSSEILEALLEARHHAVT